MMSNPLSPRVGVGVAVIHNNQLLLGKRKGAHGAGAWSFPGGHLEHGEDVEACAKRELVEETGLQPLAMHCGPWVNNVIDGDKHYVTLFVFVSEFEGEPQLMEPHKCEGWQWFESHALPTPLFPTIESLIRKIGLEQLMGIRQIIANGLLK